MRRSTVILIALPLLLCGCEGVQSALETHGPDAGRIGTIAWVLFAGATVIFIAVMGLLTYALTAGPERRRWLGSRRLVIGGGILFPVVTLSALLGWTLLVAADLTGPSGQAPLRIEVEGRMWWWEVRYPGEEDAGAFATANEIHIPVDRPVEIVATAGDVIHSFWVPSLAGKIDMIPGRLNRLRLQADRPGVFRGQCAEFCGAQHANMAFFVIAHPPDAFAEWLRVQRRPAAEPATPFLAQGRDLFVTSGCGACHTVRGVDADGRFGPDLTHVGSRRSLGAGALPNNVGTLAGWTADSQHLKPGNRMPSFNTFTGEELRAIAAWLESLR